MQIYLTLAKILKENDVTELGLLYDLIPQQELSRKEYYPFVLVESKLGIPIPVLSSAIKEAHEHYTKTSKQDYSKIEQVTRIMILLKPDNYTAMNKRKELMMSKHIRPDDEIRLLNLIFTIPKHSKSAVAWYHRQWIVTNYDCVQVQNEMKLCEMTCCFYKRNYYSWSYRFWILSRHQQEHALVEKEYSSMLSWCELNISDYSGFHYLEQIMNLMNWKLCLIDQHMKWLNNLTIKFPGHESIWCHRRYCSNLYYTKDYCISQHQFVWDILNDKYIEQALEMTRLDEQKQFALKFGLWLSILEKRRHDQYASVIDSKLICMYRKTTPDSTLLDRQG